MTVVVDLTDFDSGVIVRCVTGTPSNGLAALVGAGHAVEQVSSVPGFVCRIDGRPDQATEPCSTTPPATSSWSYWTAARGGSWTYSPVGAAASRPGQGTVEGWAFTGGDHAEPPSVAPPALVTQTPPPTAAPTARATPLATARSTPAPPRGPAATATATPAPPDEPSATASPTLQATPTAATSTPSIGDGSGRPATQPTPNASEASIPTMTETGGTGPLPTVVGLTLVLAVAGSAVAMQRRGQESSHG